MSTTDLVPGSFLVGFFSPTTKAADPAGRTLATILSWPDSQLESSHDYIQTVFPLPERSMVTRHAPLITPEVHQAFAIDPSLRTSLRQALDRMLTFYGLQFNQGESLQVSRAANFDSAKRNWVVRFDHNHLRLTRTLRSLRVLGLPNEARAFNDFLQTDQDVVGTVSPKSRMFWRRAAERPLHLPPDEEDERAKGVGWLRGVEGC